ncbi:uncharacterized protein PRCAT00004934001 [Priceomyces carsonii]|uniref:uncharacterized protein n=1 Tax=Priceomyces carsonii TaxID=28549 RepID=UPI002ED9C0D1|nr:unnamed protein product [Priceomyces carsonii]
MDYLNNILSQQSSVPKLADEAIPTLCNRLLHSTLSSDRRSAVLGLKSFSRQYRESVVEYGLRALVSTLKKDSENPSIVKAVLETLLILFIRGESDSDLTRGWISQQSRAQNGKYPSPLLLEVSTDQLSLWIADELTQDVETVKLLFDILQDSDDFYVKLYTIQLLESMVSTRSTKTKDCLLNIPTSMSVLVGLLHDANDPIRNETILLLMAVVNDNFNIQKLVAFENTFEILFQIIEEEGGIRGSILVQDCLTLLTNLLKYNASNQKFFLETQCVPNLTKLLEEPLEGGYDVDTQEEGKLPLSLPPIVWTEQRLQNIITVLEICRTFVSEDNEFLELNQSKFEQAGVLFSVLKLIFSPMTPNEVRSVALLVTGDLISGNPDIQLRFSSIEAPYMDPSLPSQIRSFDNSLPVTIALLNWTLFINSVHIFDIRTNSAYCLHAYFRDNKKSQSAFMEDQIKAYISPTYYTEGDKENGNKTENGADENSSNTENHEEAKQENGRVGESEPNGETKEAVNGSSEIVPTDTSAAQTASASEDNTTLTPFANIFSTLMDYDSDTKLNPYKVWFAAVILMYLFEDNDENKELARAVKTGDEAAGEEVMTSIQAISGLLLMAMDGTDSRIVVGCSMLLTVWMYEDLNAVNDFLSDSSTVKAILATISSNAADLTIILQGMASILLGIAYEFSSKKSPIPRSDLHSLLVKGLGRDNYSLKVRQFKDHQLLKNYESNFDLDVEKDDTGLPAIYFDPIYVNLVKENFTRIRRALFHDPESEPQAHISYEVYEELEANFTSLKKALNAAQVKATETEKYLQEENEKVSEHCKELDEEIKKLNSEIQEAKEKYNSISSKYSETSESLEELQKSKKEFEDSSSKYFNELQIALKNQETTSDSVKELENKLEQTEAMKSKLENGINNMTRDLFHLKKEKEEAERTLKSSEKEVKTLNGEIEKMKKKFEAKIDALQKTNDEFQAKITKLTEGITPHGTDLGDRNIVVMQERIEELSENNDHLMDKLRSIASAFQEIRETKISLEKELEEKISAEKDFDDFKQSANSEIEALKKSVETLKSSKTEEPMNQASADTDDPKSKGEDKVVAHDEELGQSLEQLKSENAILKKKLLQLEEHGNSSSDLNSSREHNLNSSSTDRELTHCIEEKEEQLKQLESSVATLTGKLHIFEKDLKDQNERGDGVENMNADVPEAKDFENDFENLKTEKNSLKKRLEEKEGDLSRMFSLQELRMKEFEDKEQEFNLLLKQYKDIKDQLSDSREEIIKSENKIKVIEEEKASLLKKLETVKVSEDDEVDQLKQDKENLAKELDAEALNNLELSIKIDSLESKLKEYDTFMEEEKSQLLVSQKVLEQKLKMCSTVEKEKAAISDMLARAFEKISSYEKKVEDLEKANLDLKKDLAASNGSESDLKHEIENLKLKFSNLQSELEKKREEVLKQRELMGKDSSSIIQECNLKMQELETELVTSKDEVVAKDSQSSHTTSSLNNKIASLSDDLNNYKEKLSKSHESYKKLSDDLSKTKAQKVEEVSKLEKEIDELVYEIETLKSKHNDVAQQAEEKNNSLDSSLQKIKSENGSIIESLRNENKSLNENLEKAVSSEESLLQKLEQSQAALEETSLENQSLSKQVTELISEKENRATELENEVKDLKSRMEILKDEIAKKEAETKVNEVDSKESLKDEKDVEIRKLNESNNQLQEKYQTVTDDLQKQIEKLSIELKNKSSIDDSFEGLTEDQIKKHSVSLPDATQTSSDSDSLKEVSHSYKEKENKYKEELNSMTTQLQSLKDAQLEYQGLLEKEKKNKDDLMAKVHEIEHENSTLQKSKEDFEKRKKIENEFNNFKKEAEAREQNFNEQIRTLTEKLKKRVPETEMDELIMILSEVDESKKTYKERLKELGEEVSSENDSDLSDSEEDLK